MRQIIFLLILASTPLSAAIFHPIDTTRPLICLVSKQHHNRILIDGSRIKKIIFPEDQLHVHMEEASGQAFLQAKNSTQEKIVISIISQSGLVQDLEIKFIDLPSQVIILQEKVQQPIQELSCDPYHFKENQTSIVKEIEQGRIPSGFLSVPITNSYARIKSGIKAKLVGRLQNYREEIYIYQIQNSRSWKKQIHEKDLSSNQTLWVYLQKRVLKPKETVLAIVAVQP